MVYVFRPCESCLIWSSALPKITSHWLPVVDSPRISFTTDFEFNYPSGTQLIFNGRRGSDEIVSIDQESVSYHRSEERRVGKECRSQWWREQYKTKRKK